jgi:hypothetical protein
MPEGASLTRVKKCVKFVGVLLDAELAEKLVHRAKQRDRSVSAEVRVILRRELAD